MSTYTWYYILAAELKSDYQLTMTELPASRFLKPQSFFPQSVAVQYTLKKEVTSHVMIDDMNTKLPIKSCKTEDFQYWFIAPVFPGTNGALLGELDKVVPISEQRVLTVIKFGDTYVIKMRGAPNEVVSMSTINTSSGKVATVNCTLDSTGEGTLGFSDVDSPSC